MEGILKVIYFQLHCHEGDTSTRPGTPSTRTEIWWRFSQSASVVFCPFPWKFNPTRFSFFVHFSASEVFNSSFLCPAFIKIQSILSPWQWWAVNILNNVTLTQLSTAPSSWGRIRVLWKSFPAEVGKLLPQPRKKAHIAVLCCRCKSLPCRTQTRMEKGCQH